MAGNFALCAEILGGADDSRAEKRLPETIDGDAGDQWMTRIDEPTRQREAVGFHSGGQRRERGGNTGRHGLALLVIRAADEHEGGTGLFHFRHHHRGRDERDDGGTLLFQGVEATKRDVFWSCIWTLTLSLRGLLDGSNFRVEARERRGLLRGGSGNLGRGVPLGAIDAAFRNVIEEGEQSIEIFLG